MAGFSLGLSRLISQRPAGNALANAAPDATGKVYTVSGLKPGSSAILYANGTQTATTTVDGTGKATWTLASKPAFGAVMTYDGTVTGSAGAVPVPTSGPYFTVQPSVSPTYGTAGQVFTVVDGTTINGSVSARQWTLNGLPISGATGASYASTTGGTLTCIVTAIGSGGSTSATTTAETMPAVVVSVAQASSAQASSRSSEVSAAANDSGRSSSAVGPFTALVRPTISGKPLVGQTLVGYAGLWDASAGLSYSWSVGGTAVSGQTSRRYVVQAADAGKAITFTVTPNAGTAASAQPITAVAAFDALVTEGGAALTTEGGAAINLDDRIVRWLAPYSATQSRADKLSNPKMLAAGYAVTDADIFVGPSSLPVSLYAPGSKIVNIWHSGANQLSITPDSDGYCQGVLPLSGIANGALIIEAHALVDNTTEGLAVSALYAQITVMVRGSAAPSIPTTPTGAQGLTLAFSDEFATTLSASQANTRPSGVKWYGSMAFDKNGYGDAIFADPNGPASPYAIIDGLLRIRCTYDPATAATLNDPYNRKWIGGCLTSSFPDGSTSVPTMGNGYYECRMLCPIGIGTWPAFWLNDQQSLLLKAAGTPTPNGRETDIVEQYNETNGYVSTQHRYQKDSTGASIDKSTAFNIAIDKGKMGWAWRRFGAKVTDSAIVYYLDDQVVATDPSKYHTAASGKPDLDHIILTMAMNGGWPVAVPPSGYYDMYVDYVRYWQ